MECHLVSWTSYNQLSFGGWSSLLTHDYLPKCSVGASFYQPQKLEHATEMDTRFNRVEELPVEAVQ